jgi:lipoprotein-anchoring transpeptidase ErfK/SrfK
VRRALGILLVAAAITAAPARAGEDEPRIEDDVTIAGVDVGRMTAEEATEAIQASFAQPLVFKHRARSWRVGARAFGARADFARAVRAALDAGSGEAVPLAVTVNQYLTRRYAERLHRRFTRAAVNSRVVLRSLRPRLTKPRPGFRVNRVTMRVLIRNSFLQHLRDPLRLRGKVLRPRVTRANFGPVVVIRRGSRRLYLYSGIRYRASFGVAVGMPQYPTPLGRFSIVVKERNPWWNPPSAGWAAGASPIPPGPGNPLGTRWMGLSVGAVGIHGTPDAASIGYSASHGCIRMRISAAEWLFERVRIGTPVFIVGA